ncbi:PREDICTED: cytochrome b561 domain-containing protein At4g18260-like [Tarenaya hassleriana]|uniref:cytochrome b561 domain-containing protein At4g18260-like n=1 Tax=Tarenaya hassleriana TaxID=28532 RepID=UPI00053C7F6D|nr:PREDICTED: cytochrome b561 domain-containing protein At4g18260-like [Tarenaya hassleriana]
MLRLKPLGFVFVAYILLFHVSNFPPFVESSSIEDTISHSPIIHDNKEAFQDKLNHQMAYSVKLHGILLWVSMGFFMPLGILSIRMANKFHETERKVKVFFYLHAISQILAVLLATAGAIMSLRTLENSFNNTHQRLGLALYAAMWLQFLTGVFKPSRESRRRIKWYIWHWMLGTIVTVVGVINIYTGIRAYQHKTSTRDSSSLWTILFTAEISCLVLLYLFQDKWEHFQQNLRRRNDNPSDQIIQVAVTRNDQKVLVPQPCGKSNALMNLFE